MKSDTQHRVAESNLNFEDLKAILDQSNLLQLEQDVLGEREIDDIIKLYFELHVFDKPSFVEYTFGGSYLTKDEAGQEYYRLKNPTKIKIELSMQENQDIKKAIGLHRSIPSGYKMLQIQCNRYNQATLIATKGAKLS